MHGGGGGHAAAGVQHGVAGGTLQVTDGGVNLGGGGEVVAVVGRGGAGDLGTEGIIGYISKKCQKNHGTSV